MKRREINVMGLRRRQQGEVEVPKIIEDLLRRIEAEQVENYENSDTDRIVDIILHEYDHYGNGVMGIGGYGNHKFEEFNLIPSSSDRRGCTELLVTFCYKNDSFEKRILESLDHASKHCKNTKDIYFFTTKWNTTIFEKLLGHIELLRDIPVNIVFIYIGNEGFVWMPD